MQKEYCLYSQLFNLFQLESYFRTIYVTHDQVEAMTLADQIVVLDRGQIQQIGDPQEIYAQPANRMVAAFLGNPGMNVFRGTYTGEGFFGGGSVFPLFK